MLTALIISILSLASSYKQTSIDFKNDIKVNDKLDFFIIGDWGFKPLSSIISSNWDPHRQVADRMIELAEIYKPSMIINTGDNFYSGGLYQFSGEGVKGINDGRWKDFWSDVYLRDSMKNVPFFSVLGNHDWIGNVDSQIEYSNKKINPMWWETTIKLPESFCKGNKKCVPEASFIFIDTNYLQYGYSDTEFQAVFVWPQFKTHNWTDDSVAIDQLAWIESRLEKYKNSAFTFMVGHHPLGLCVPSRWMQNVSDLLQKYETTAYMYGHQHYLEQSMANSTMHILSGAGGKKHYPVVDGICSGSNLKLNHQSFNMGFVRGFIEQDGFKVEYYNMDGARVYSSSVLKSRMDK